MDKIHDTLFDLGRGTPSWFIFAARILPVSILSQFLSAGFALFGENSLWRLHAATGGALSFSVFVLFISALLIPRLRGFRWWGGLTVVLYVMQVILVAGAIPYFLALHPFNGALLLGAGSILLFKVERRVAAGKRGLV